ncbi:MAG: MBL fold metallo-hydrolase [Selenomonadaceae bacterium]|nr:MBL fold metallo-hydrolase [Selenomonadaceae bacterium]MBR6887144.1 MBL fold metallo-hydrolase [Selenomonadaceae bacterium]
MATLTVLIENTKPAGSELIAEHGLSFLVETSRTKFIFDCGHTGAAFDNAKTLGIDLRGIKIVALSHSHYDHAGGFPRLLAFAPIETLYTGENFWEEKFSLDKYRGCGFDRNFLAERGIEQKICRDVLELDDTVWLVGNFKRRYDFENIPEKFLRGNKKIPDDFSDEIVLVLRGRDGVSIVTACAHSGILNIVADVRERFSAPIHCVIGGLHLTGATQERISRTLAELKNLGVKKILPCHCSGEDFIKHCGEKISTGSVVEI